MAEFASEPILMRGQQSTLVTGRGTARKVRMPAYSRGDASLESYLVKILAAICRANGGQIRVKGDQVDMIDQPVTLMKFWDQSSQELVLTTHMGSFAETFRAIP